MQFIYESLVFYIDSSDEEEGQVGVASDQGREGQRTLYKRM